MQAQESEARIPLRLSRLPHPRRPLVDRRQTRPMDTATALISAFDHSVARADLDALIVADESGILVSNNTTDLDLSMLAAVTPLVARGTAKAMIRRDGLPLELSVRTIEVLGETLYVAALGGSFGNRERELATSASATKRILMA
jgi:hypothetical protein